MNGACSRRPSCPRTSTLVPGVIGHCTDFIEHPDLVAERLVRYAKLVGRENVLAGTDCGIGSRVGHELICWAKFEAMSEGARRATKTLWGKTERLRASYLVDERHGILGRAVGAPGDVAVRPHQNKRALVELGDRRIG